ncbi:serine/threonine/tyrosine-interacting protein B-like [Physella acuta]|uniref:serine/threonine/tyrosine-interacting protein B-like n=1 Tax=Physella acuta TaxID=109671 RepID=UPI0027DE8DDB|nr:serine/threonine/tyrosine-interacting protein B-like [Physella acuta]XP_059178148.1 serine/threonine/tyrosine-interacting protein B-like [Physella acuta]
MMMTSPENDLETEWQYAMRREMQEIIPGLFLGPYGSALRTKLDSLMAAGITHIICIRQSIEANFVRPNFPEHFRYLVLNMADSPTENIIKYFQQTKDFIDDCLNQGGKVLVHGNGGISRSAAVVTAYVMEKLGLTCREALVWVRNKRLCISLNDGFLHQLTEYEHIYRAKSLSNISEAATQQSGKRKRMEMEGSAFIQH